MKAVTRTTPLVRIGSGMIQRVLGLIFGRYPSKEWATFGTVGWRDTTDGLIVTLAGIDAPIGNDLDDSVANVALASSYSLRTALAAERHRFGIALFHSHPQDCLPIASYIDDDMDGYYSGYFADFAPGRPYVSIIASRMGAKVVMSGRIYWKRQWHQVRRFAAETFPIETWDGTEAVQQRHHRWERLSSALGEQALERLRRSTVAVIGAGGTGSAAIECLARAGVGRLIIVDRDKIESSNLERVHGSFEADAAAALPKVLVAKRHVKSIRFDLRSCRLRRCSSAAGSRGCCTPGRRGGGLY